MKQAIIAQSIVSIIREKFEKALSNIFIPGEYDSTKLLDYLNITWYDRKLRLESNKDWIKSLNFSLGKVYADVTITNEAITFSTDIDQKVEECLVEFICPSSKIKILEYALSVVKMENMGKAIDFDFEKQLYTMFISIGNMGTGDVITTSFGESMLASVSCTISIMPKVATYNDYKISFSFENDQEGIPIWMDTPLNEISINKTANQKNVPYQNAQLVGTRNISAATMWGVSFWALNTDLSEKVTVILLDDEYNMDAPFLMRIIYKGSPFIYNVKFATLSQKLTNNEYVLTSATLSRHSSPSVTVLSMNSKMARGGQNG